MDESSDLPTTRVRLRLPRTLPLPPSPPPSARPTCSVCLDSVAPHEAFAFACDDRHVYHQACATDVIVKGNSSCCVCRVPVCIRDLRRLRPYASDLQRIEEGLYETTSAATRRATLELFEAVVRHTGGTDADASKGRKRQLHAMLDRALAAHRPGHSHMEDDVQEAHRLQIEELLLFGDLGGLEDEDVEAAQLRFDQDVLDDPDYMPGMPDPDEMRAGRGRTRYRRQRQRVEPDPFDLPPHLSVAMQTI